jgi:uncharacterized protein YjbJ (UPF0337 family)
MGERVSLFRRLVMTAKGATFGLKHLKGNPDKAKGAIKETAGKVSGDRELASEGKVERRWAVFKTPLAI